MNQSGINHWIQIVTRRGVSSDPSKSKSSCVRYSCWCLAPVTAPDTCCVIYCDILIIVDLVCMPSPPKLLLSRHVCWWVSPVSTTNYNLLWHFDCWRFGLHVVTTKVDVVSSRLSADVSLVSPLPTLVVTFWLLTIWITCRVVTFWLLTIRFDLHTTTTKVVVVSSRLLMSPSCRRHQHLLWHFDCWCFGLHTTTVKVVVTIWSWHLLVTRSWDSCFGLSSPVDALSRDKTGCGYRWVVGLPQQGFCGYNFSASPCRSYGISPMVRGPCLPATVRARFSSTEFNAVGPPPLGAAGLFLWTGLAVDSCFPLLFLLMCISVAVLPWRNVRIFFFLWLRASFWMRMRGRFLTVHNWFCTMDDHESRIKIFWQY